MNPLALDEAMRSAVEHHFAGRLAEAEDAYRRIVSEAPDCAAAWNNYAVILHGRGEAEAAIRAYREAIRILPQDSDSRFNLGTVYQSRGQFEEAIPAYRHALSLNPRHAAAANNLGNALLGAGKLEEAIEILQQVLRLDPTLADAWTNLGNAFYSARRFEQAATAHRRALDLNPASAETHYNLGVAMAAGGHIKEAIESYRRALEVKPDFIGAWNNLGIALLATGKEPEAAGAFERVLQIKPDYLEAWNNLGTALLATGKIDEAATACGRAVALAPTHAEAANNLGNAYKEQGRLNLAIECFRRAIALNPRAPHLHSNLVYALNFLPEYGPADIRAEVDCWHRQHAAVFEQQVTPRHHDASPERKLRVGCVSPNFNDHVVGRSIYPFLRGHDRRSFEVYCYSDTLRPDALSEQLRSFADIWRDTASLNDEEVTQAVRRDQIDILVDLTLHMGRNRLLVFARKPAPVQVTYLGYCGTTGLAPIDYRLSDPYLDPPESDLQAYSEETLRLARTYWCYDPLEKTPEVSPLPALAAGHITFGCLNNFAKVSEPALDLWSQVLKGVPNSRLFLHAPGQTARERVLQRLARWEISADRLRFSDHQARDRYFQTWQEIDIGLDPFPYGGGITTCDALWMGVPVVTLSGQTSVGRGGCSILSNIGLSELVGETPRQYVELAVGLAADLPRLAASRASLRARMDQSPLRDSKAFARDLEAAFQQMWRRWCEKRQIK